MLYNIDTIIAIDYPELIQLIKKSKSMDNEEKQSWFNLLPQMEEDKIDRLYDILYTEKIRLEELEKLEKMEDFDVVFNSLNI